jgi:hypothetical protein
MNKKHLIIVVILLSILFSFILFWNQFSFKTESIYITEHSLGVKESISFVYINSSLSSSYIQVRKVNKETNEEYLLETYQNYDNMVGYALCKDTLAVFLRKGYWINSNSSNFIECDTFHLNINNIKWKIK